MYDNVDLFDLERFVKAQDTYDSYNIALKEIKDGWKQSHWMWYVFPQVHGLGHSSTSQKFSIKSLLEALAYLRHDTLGKRLYEVMKSSQIFWRTISTRSVVRKPFRLCHQSCPIIREMTHSQETESKVKCQELSLKGLMVQIS